MISAVRIAEKNDPDGRFFRSPILCLQKISCARAGLICLVRLHFQHSVTRLPVICSGTSANISVPGPE